MDGCLGCFQFGASQIELLLNIHIQPLCDTFSFLWGRTWKGSAGPYGECLHQSSTCSPSLSAVSIIRYLFSYSITCVEVMQIFMNGRVNIYY